jgi:hypothetical protein
MQGPAKIKPRHRRLRPLYIRIMDSAYIRLGYDALLAGLKAAAEDTRLRLLLLLAEAELTVSDLTEILGQSQPRISRHLKLLA